MSYTVFIDGQAGTTGLQLSSRLREHPAIDVLSIEDRFRKDRGRRRELLEQAEVSVLCLPDDAAREAVELAPAARFLDASTAHRVAQGWTYGLPELSVENRQAIRSATRVSNPGCYPTGFILSVRPLIEAGLLSAGTPLRVNAVSGYSGGGKSLIDKYECRDAPAWRWRSYGLGLSHKHVPEMHRYAKTARAPLFTPSVGHYYNGMVVQVGLFACELEGGAGIADVHRALTERYADELFVHVAGEGEAESALEDGFLSPTLRNGSNHLDILVFGHSEQLLIVSRYDNLGKGAATAAVQNLNLMLGFTETAGLEPAATEPALEAVSA